MDSRRPEHSFLTGPTIEESGAPVELGGCAILVVDDNRLTRRLLEQRLGRRGFTIQAAESGEDALALAKKSTFDLVLLDLMMPGLDGVETLRRLRTDHSQTELPVVMLSAREGSSDVIEALKAGANDFVAKSADFEVVRARIETQLRLRGLMMRIQEMAIRDPLTGLYNRRGFYELAEKEERRTERYGGGLHALLIDLDHFKRINDRQGHRAGDKVLVAVAAVCERTLRTSDLIGRWGEEFAILLPEIDAEGAFRTAERLREAVAAAPVETPDGSVAVRMSGGLAAYDAGCRSLGELLNRADRALYEAKRQGRNQIRVWRQEDSPN